MLANGWMAALAAVPLMITLFLGIESAVEIGEEVRDPQRGNGPQAEREHAERIAAQEALELEQKAKRDARYAARKAQKKKGGR